MVDQRAHERCQEEAGEALVLYNEKDEPLKGLIVDWSMNGLGFVMVKRKLNLELGDQLKYAPESGNVVSLEAPDNILYVVARIHPLGNNIYLVGLQTIDME